MFPGGFDPSKVDPKIMAKMQSLIQRLPRGQLTQLQNVMQKAMAGQDVTAEAMQLQRMLPPEFLQLAMQMQMGMGGDAGAAGAMPGMGMGAGMPGMGMGAPTPAAIEEPELSEEEAMRIVAEAAKDGKLSGDQAKELLGEDPDAVLAKQDGGVKKFFKGMIGKN